MKVIDAVKNTAFTAAINSGLKYLEKDPEVNIPKLMSLVDKAAPEGWYEGARNMIRNAIEEKGNWYDLIMKIYQLDPGVRKNFFQNFIVNASLKGSAIHQDIMAKEDCNGPWAILLDPTSACNLHCTGCWAAEYGHKLNLDLDTIDNIVKQGKKLGIYMYIYTGGEPLVRKKDLITLCERHPDCEFLSFTNGTLIDEAFCEELLRVKNFVPAISLEGFETANDGRRGEGVYGKVKHAMKLLKDQGIKVRWYVLGEGELRQKLQQKIDSLGLTEDFVLLGARENPYPYYRQCDLYVHATRFEGKSIAVQEAQILGCTILVSDCSGNREQVKNGTDGILCQLSAEEISRSIRELLKDEEKCRQYGENASKRISDEQEDILQMFA